MRRIYATIIASLAFFALGAKDAAPLPPIGKRTYVIDGANPAAPVTIKKDSAKAKIFLKDPVHPSAPIKMAPAKLKPKPKVVAQAPKDRTGRMRFGKVNVNGHLRHPRVEFSRDVLPVERADELTSPDFFQKVYEPALDQDF